MRYDDIQNRHQGSKETFFEDASTEATQSGLTVADMAAAVTSGNAVSIPTQTFNSETDELSYLVSFDRAGEAVVTVTTTFQGTEETMISKILYRTKREAIVSRDYW